MQLQISTAHVTKGLSECVCICRVVSYTICEFCEILWLNYKTYPDLNN